MAREQNEEIERLQSQLALVTADLDEAQSNARRCSDDYMAIRKTLAATEHQVDALQSQLSAREAEIARLREALHKIWCAHRSLAYVQEIAHAALAAPVTEKE